MKLPLRFLDWPLRAKMAALLVVASLLPLGIAAFIDIRESRERLLSNTANLLEARGDQLVQRLDVFHYGYQRSVDRVSRFDDVVRYCESLQQQNDRLNSSVRKLLDGYPASDTNIRGAAILDLNGNVVSATEKQLIGLNLSYRSFVREALRGVPVISDIYIADPKVGSVPTIAYLAPVFGPGRKLIGLAALWVHATSLWNVMKALNQLAGSGSFAVLFDRRGIRIAHT